MLSPTVTGHRGTLDPTEMLHALLTAPLYRTCDMPADAVGLYVLADHEGRRSYIGCTKAANESFRRRIHARHRTGSETHSHMFSRTYNVGRMWRDRATQRNHPDGDLAKRLRNAFIAEYCRAACVPLDPKDYDILAMEADVLAIAPPEVTVWNGGRPVELAEPTELVDAMMDKLGFDASQRSALDRQAQIHERTAQQAQRATQAAVRTAVRSQPTASRPSIPPLPDAPFEFAALDVETANHDRSSICQIGVAFVRNDGSIETWSTYVDPQTTHFVFTGLHGISARTVAGAPTFAQLLPSLEQALDGLTVYQHSNFDRGAVRAACVAMGRGEPDWTWEDSVMVARRAWPELRGAGGHGLASLKQHLGLVFEHHDAGEDARAAAEVVLRARAKGTAPIRSHVDASGGDEGSKPALGPGAATSPVPQLVDGSWTILGHVALTQGNIDNHHFYLRDVFSALPQSCIGGSNARSAASETLEVDWGHPERVRTDVDGSKKIFRKRGWVRSFLRGARAGDRVRIELSAPRHMRVTVVR